MKLCDTFMYFGKSNLFKPVAVFPIQVKFTVRNYFIFTLKSRFKKTKTCTVEPCYADSWDGDLETVLGCVSC